jgi:hypothetical protein
MGTSTNGELRGVAELTKMIVDDRVAAHFVCGGERKNVSYDVLNHQPDHPFDGFASKGVLWITDDV